MMINKKQMWSDNPFDQWTEEELLCMKNQGICYGKGGGGSPPPPPATQTVRQSSEFPEELKPFVSDIFGKAQAIQEQRQEEGFRPELTQQLASFTPDQQAAFTGIREQIGQTRPLFQEATNLARGATRAATDPAEVAALMNPFLRNVTDIEKREAQRVADVQEQQLAAQAAQAGAFGGSRAAVLEAERQRNLAQQLGDIEARGRAAAFQDAQARLQNQFAREGSGAAQLSALGAAIPAQTFKELGALSGIGAAEQQQTQRALDIATQQAREEYGFPMQTLQDFQSILRGFPLPATTNVSRQTFSPAQPLSTQLLGLGTGLAGLAGAAGAFKKAGGLVGAPVAMKDGGYVKLAGGGGLGQLMQGKLPSNRVRMGKTAYQDVSRVPISSVASVPELTLGQYIELFPESKKAIIDLLHEKTRYLENQPKEIRSQAQEALLNQSAADVLPRSRKKPDFDVAGNVATQGIQAAGTAATPSVPVDQAKNPADLSLLQKAMGTLDDLVTGVDTARPSKDPFSMSPAPALVSAPPVDDQAQTVTTNLNLPQLLSGQTLDPGGADALPQPGTRQSIQERFPLRIGARVDRTPPPEMAELDAKSPIQLGFGELLAPNAMGVRERKIQEETEGGVGAEFARVSGKDRVSDTPVSSKARRSPAAGRSFDITELLPFRSGSPNLLSAQARQQARRGTLETGDIEAPDDPALGYADSALTDELDAAQAAAQADADAVRKNIKAEGSKAPAAGPLTSEEPKNPAEVAAAQKSYDQQIADIKNKDYAADIKKMLGDAPTYEKGEEPDFAARKWLALANFGAGILASGGGKTLAQSIGEAAKPALKELVDIGKEERKIKKELRQERNAQKRADYQDKLQRFNLQRQLKSDDLDHTRAMADIADKKARRIIDEKTLAERIRANTALINKQIIDTATAQYALDNAKTGRTTSGQAQKAILDSIQQTRNTIIKNRQLGFPTNVAEENRQIMNAARQTAALYAPTTVKEVKGEDGKIRFEKVDLTKFIPNLGGTPKGGTTVVVPGSKATITMGNVSN